MHGNRHFFFFPFVNSFFFFFNFWRELSSSLITGDHREMLKKKVRSRKCRYFDSSIFAPSFVLNHFSCVRLWDPMDCSPPGSLCMGFPRQEYWNGLSCPASGDLPGSRNQTRVPYISYIGRHALYH